MSFILLMSFTLSYLLVQSGLDRKSVFHFDDNLYLINGEVANVSSNNTTRIVSLNIININNLSDNTRPEHFPRIVNISVSPFTEVQLFDEIEVVGEIRESNFQNHHNFLKKNFIPEEHSHEKLFPSSRHNVSNMKSFKVTQGNYHEKTLLEKLIIQFYETSENIQNKIDGHMKDPYVGIAKGITFGNQQNIIKDIRMSFIDSGLIHIMVLSGANVSFIILLFFWLLNHLSQTRYRLLQKIDLRIKVFTTILMSCAFVFATGLAAPSLRALVMVNTGILAEYLSRNFSIKKSVLVSLFILTLVNPFALVYSASLHLSYLAILGLVYVLPKLLKLENQTQEKFEINILLDIFKQKFFKSLVATFLAITISVGPYLLAMSEQINLLGTVASIVLEPVILCVTILTFLITLVSSSSFLLTTFVANILANLLGVINSSLVSIILNTSNFLAKDIFIFHTTINFTFVKLYYLIFILYFFVFKND